MERSLKSLATSTAIVLLATQIGAPARAGVVQTVDAPGVQASQVPGVVTETFNSFSTGEYSSLSTALGTLTTSGQFAIVAADQYGGAGGTGNYFALGAQSGSSEPVTLTFNGPQSYFGMWWSAADVYNNVQLYSGDSLLATYTTATIFDGLPSSYYGNPNSGADQGEPFAYVNFNGTSGTTFTSVVISNSGTTATGFESDNFSINGVPEPSSLVLAGSAAAIGGLVVLQRRRRRARSGLPAIA